MPGDSKLSPVLAAVAPQAFAVGPVGRMSRSEAAALLGEVPLFAGLSKRHLRRIADGSTVARFPAGRTIIQQARPGDTFYVIVAGKVKVLRGTRRVGSAERGGFFGELALITGAPRSASVVAETSVVTLRLPRGVFRKMVLREPEIGLRIMTGLAERLQKIEPGD